ncbi:hypothetical protein [Halomonas mongoliensis]|uniref:hypothetical protein n=1 Tax=Halomonas mongoliensis TaxID=321265 RepID=UPI00403A9F87
MKNPLMEFDMATGAMENLMLLIQLPNGEQVSVPVDELAGMELPQGARITLIDSVTGQPPANLAVKRLGNDLILEVDGEEVATLADFFTTPDVSFYPEGDLSLAPDAAGAITTESAVLAREADGSSLLWSADEAGSAAIAGASSGGMGGATPWILGGLAVGGVAAAAGGSSSSGGGSAPVEPVVEEESEPEIPPGSVTVSLDGDTNPIDRDTANAVVISGSTENIAEGETVTLVITDGSNEVSAEAVVEADGSYSATADLRGLSDGELTITASVTDLAGDTATASTTVDYDSFDAVVDDGVLTLSGRHIYVEETDEGTQFVNWRDFSADDDIQRDGDDDQVVFPDEGDRVSVLVTDDVSSVVIEDGLTVYVNKALIDNQGAGDDLTISGDGNLWLLVGDISDQQQTAFDAQLNIELSGGILTFDMPSDNYELTLLDGSVIKLGGGTLEVSDGDLKLQSGVSIEGADNIILNSSLELNRDQLESLSAKDISGQGSLIVLAENDADANEIYNFLAQNGALFSADDAPTVSLRSLNGLFEDTAVDLQDIDGSRNGFVSTRADQLKAEIDAIVGEGGPDALTQDLGTLVELGAALSSLQTIVAANDAAQTQALADAKAALEGMIDALSARVTDEVTRLEGELADLDSALTADIAQVAADLAALDGVVAALSATVDANDAAQTQALADAKTALEGMIDALSARVTDEVTRLEGELADLDSALTADIAQVAADLAALDGVVAALSATVDANDAAQTQALADAKAALEGMIDALSARVTDEVTRLEGELADLDSALTADIAQVAADLAALDGVVAALSVTVDANDAAQTQALADAKTALEGMIDALSARVTDEVTRLEGELADLDSALTADIAQVAADLAALDGVVAALSVTVAANDAAQTQALADAKTALEGMIDALSARVTDEVTRLEGELADLDSALTADIAQVAADLAALDGVVAALSATVDANDAAQTAALDAARTSLEAMLTDLSDRVTSEVSRLEGEIAQLDTDLSSDIAQVASDLAALDGVVAALSATVDANDANDAAQTAALDAARTSLEAMLTDLSDRVTSEVSRLEGEIAQLDTDLSADIAQVAADLAALDGVVAALSATVDANDAAQTAALDAARTSLEAMLTDLSDRVTSEVTRLEGEIAQLDTDLSADIAQVAADLAALDGVVAALSATVDANDAAQTQALADAKAALEGMIDALSARVTDEVTRLEGELADLDSALTADIAQVASDLAALDGVVAALSATVDANDAAQTQALADAKAALEGMIDALSARVTDEVTRLEGELADLDSALTADIAQVATDLAALQGVVTTLSGTVDANKTELQGKIDGVQANLDTAISTLTDTLNTEVARLEGLISAGDAVVQGNLDTVAADLATLQGVVTALQDTVADNKTELQGKIDTVQGNLDAANQTLEARLADLAEALQGAGLPQTVAEVTALDADDPILSNYRLVDTAENLLDENVDQAVFQNAKAIIVEDDTLDASDANDLAKLGVDFAASTYSLTGDGAELAKLDAAVLNGAINIKATGETPYADALVLMRAGNSGTTEIEKLVVNSAEATSVQYDNNDVVIDKVVTGSFVERVLDLSHTPVGSNITFNGRSGNETLILPEGPSTSPGDFIINMGAGDDTVVFYGGPGNDDQLVLSSDTVINFGSGDNTLFAVGGVVLSNATIAVAVDDDGNPLGTWAVVAQTGSNSVITLNEKQAENAEAITGDGSTLLKIVGTGGEGGDNGEIDLTGTNLAGINKLEIGDVVTTKLTLAQLDELEVDRIIGTTTGQVEVDESISVAVALKLGDLLAPGFILADASTAIEAVTSSEDLALLGRAGTIKTSDNDTLSLDVEKATALIGTGAPAKIANGYTLSDTLANLTAADTVRDGAASYTLSDVSLTAAALTDQTVAGLAVAQAAAVKAVRENSVVDGATNGDSITINNGIYTLLDTLENLTAADTVRDGAESYTLSDASLTAAALTDQTVAGLADAQAAAVKAVRDNSVVADATNGATIDIENGTYTLLDTLANLTAGDTVRDGAASYTLSDVSLTAAALTDQTAAGLAVAQAAAVKAVRENSVVDGATNGDSITINNGIYTLLDTLENLTAADTVRDGAESYTLSDASLTAAALTDQTVAGLADAQAAAVKAVRDNSVVADATNGATIDIENGTYTLLDTLANLTAGDTVRDGAASYTLSDVSLTAAALTDQTAAGLAVAQAAAVKAVRENSVVDGATNGDSITINNGTYTLLDTLENLEGDPGVVAGANEYTITDIATTFLNVAVAELPTLEQQTLIDGAANSDDFVYSLSDSYANIRDLDDREGGREILGGAQKYEIEDTASVLREVPIERARLLRDADAIIVSDDATIDDIEVLLEFGGISIGSIEYNLADTVVNLAAATSDPNKAPILDHAETISVVGTPTFAELQSLYDEVKVIGEFAVRVEEELSLFADVADAQVAAGNAGVIWNFAAEQFEVFHGMSIQAAIDAAESGDTIRVHDGSYDQVVLDKSVTLEAVNLGDATIVGNGTANSGAVQIAQGVAGATVEGFTIISALGNVAGIHAVGNNSDITIIHNIVSGEGSHAFLSGGAGGAGLSESTIEGNSFTGAGPQAVVYVNGQASLSVDATNIAFTANTVTGESGAGLLVGLESSDGAVSGNTFAGEASYASLELFGADNTVAGNAFNADGPQAIADPNADYDGADLVGVNTFDTGTVYIESTGNVFTTIQAAIDAAEAGDTLIVSKGVYDENIIIDKSIHLVGPNGEAVGHGERADEAVIGGKVEITADDASLTGFTLTKPSTSTTDNGINFSGWGGNNLLVLADGVTVENNFIEAFGADGGFSDGSGFVRLGGSSTFEGNVVRAGDGYDAANDARGVSSIWINADIDDAVTVSNNHLLVSTNVTASGDADAIFLNNAGAVVIDGNLIKGTDGGFVAFGDYGKLTITNNTIVDYAMTGLRIYESTNGTKPDVVLSGNNIDASGDQLVFIDGAVKLGSEGDGFDAVATNFTGIPAIYRANGLDGDFGVFEDGNLSLFADIEDAQTAAGESSVIWDFDAEQFLVFDGMSIQAAVNAAEEGDTITVADGRYGPVTLDKGLSLIAAGANVEITGAGVNQGAALRVADGVEGVSITGFSLAAGAGDLAAVYVVGNNKGISLDGNTITGGAAHAVLTGGGVDRVTLTGNTISGDGPAAVVYVNGTTSVNNGSRDVSLIGNTITGGANAGLLVGLESTEGAVQGNSFAGSASYASLELFGAGNAVTGNAFTADGLQAIAADPKAVYDGADLVGFNTFDTGTVYIESTGNVFTTIQAAIDAAEAGDTLIVSEAGEIMLANDGVDIIINSFQVDQDLIVLDEALTNSTMSGDVERIDATDDGTKSAFDLSANEFGLIRLAASDDIDLGDAKTVANLLNDRFNFELTIDNSEMNTSIFAIGSDDETLTAIWAHEQSEPNDSTVDASELTRLTLVNTIDGSFTLGNFGIEEDTSGSA